VKNEVLHKVKEERNILRIIKRRKGNWIGHVLRRNCVLEHIIAGKLKGTGERRIRREQLLDNLQETGRYWKLKQ
jgi:hypothetical protein